jgi:uncharacterized protein YecE (DUF72 family)
VTVLAGASGFSFPSWRPGFYPAALRPDGFLSFYAERLPAVEVNGTFYRMPKAAQLERWAAAVPDGFRFAVKAPRAVSVGGRLDLAAAFSAEVRALGDRLGPILVRLADGRARDDEYLRALVGAFDDDLRVVLDPREPSWDGVEPLLAELGAVRVNQLDAPAAFRYVRLREPPYDDDALRAWAGRLGEIDAEVFAFFRHEDAPTAPAYAARLLELVAG